MRKAKACALSVGGEHQPRPRTLHMAEAALRRAEHGGLHQRQCPLSARKQAELAVEDHPVALREGSKEGFVRRGEIRCAGALQRAFAGSAEEGERLSARPSVSAEKKQLATRCPRCVQHGGGSLDGIGHDQNIIARRALG